VTDLCCAVLCFLTLCKAGTQGIERRQARLFVLFSVAGEQDETGRGNGQRAEECQERKERKERRDNTNTEKQWRERERGGELTEKRGEHSHITDRSAHPGQPLHNARPISRIIPQ